MNELRLADRPLVENGNVDLENLKLVTDAADAANTPAPRLEGRVTAREHVLSQLEFLSGRGAKRRREVTLDGGQTLSPDEQLAAVQVLTALFDADAKKSKPFEKNLKKVSDGNHEAVNLTIGRAYQACKALLASIGLDPMCQRNPQFDETLNTVTKVKSALQQAV